MKILVVSQYFYPETFRVNTFCSELVKRGHEVTVLTGYPQYPQGKIYDGYGFFKPYEKEWNSVKIERIKVLPRGKTVLGLLLNSITFVILGNRWVKKCQGKYDIIYVFEVSPVTVGLPAVTYKHKFGTPIFFNVQDLWPENVEIVLGIKNRLVIGLINKIVDDIYAHSDLILCSSDSFVKNIESRGVPREKIVFWPQFCEQPDFVNMKKPKIYNKEYINIVFTGNIGKAQGLELMIDVAKKLIDTNIRWYLVGDGRNKDKLEKRVISERLHEHVFFVGKVSEHEANEYIYFADYAYISFSANRLFEMTLPAKLQSYLACGTPILAAVGGESAEVIKKSKSGYVCNQDSENIEKMIREILLGNNDLFTLRRNAREFFKKNYSLEKLIDDFEKMMEINISR